MFYDPRVIPNCTPPPIFGIEQVSSATMLDVYTQENFSCDMHFKQVRDSIYLRLWGVKVLA